MRLQSRAIAVLTAAIALSAPLAPVAAADAPVRTARDIIDAAPAADWRDLDPANTLYMQLDSGLVVMELAPGIAPQHVANIRALAKGRFWDGLSIYRSQDNFVVQFGDPDADDADRHRPFPTGTLDKLPAEFSRVRAESDFVRMPDADGWAPQVGFVDGFPAGRDPASGDTWLAHCYGALGAGRNNAPDSSLGAELYVVIGQSPRQLDRNITVVGRVLQGMEWLSSIARGPEPMGFYEQAAQRVPIRSIRLGSDVPPAERVPLQVLRTDSASFRDATEARRNRRDPFYHRPAGHIDLCNVPLPTRTRPDA